MAVVRNHDQRAGIVEQGVLERVPHVEIKMIGRLVEQQQVRPAINHQRQRQACLFATGERFDLLHRTVAAEVEADEEVDRKSVVWGKSVSVRVDLGGRRIIKKKQQKQMIHKE